LTDTYTPPPIDRFYTILVLALAFFFSFLTAALIADHILIERARIARGIAYTSQMREGYTAMEPAK
jgi:hypothetical protein